MPFGEGGGGDPGGSPPPGGGGGSSFLGSGGFGGGTAFGQSRTPNLDVLNTLYGPRRRRRLAAVTANGSTIPISTTSMDQYGGGGGGPDPHTMPPGAPGSLAPPDWSQAGGGFQGQGQDYWSNIIGNLIGQGGQAGAFDPTGGGPWLDAVQKMLEDQYGARARGAMLGAESRGVDPSQFGYLSSLGEIGAGQDISNLLGQARVQRAGDVTGFLQNLLGAQLGGGIQDWLATQQFGRDKALQRMQSRGGLGDALGGLLGLGVGAFTGGLGSGLGSRLGGAHP